MTDKYRAKQEMDGGVIFAVNLDEKYAEGGEPRAGALSASNRGTIVFGEFSSFVAFDCDAGREDKSR